MIDVDRIRSMMVEKKERDEQSRREEELKRQEKNKQDEEVFVHAVQYNAENLQAEIEKAISTNRRSISVLSDHFIPHLLDRRRFGNMFYEQYTTPYSQNKYPNPFYEMYDGLLSLGMQWVIEHTEASRDPEYRYDAYDMLVLLIPRY